MILVLGSNENQLKLANSIDKKNIVKNVVCTIT